MVAGCVPVQLTHAEAGDWVGEMATNATAVIRQVMTAHALWTTYRGVRIDPPSNQPYLSLYLQGAARQGTELTR